MATHAARRAAGGGREKIVKPTPHAVAFLAAQREAAARIEAWIRDEWDPARWTRCTGCSTRWAARTNRGWPST